MISDEDKAKAELVTLKAWLDWWFPEESSIKNKRQ